MKRAWFRVEADLIEDDDVMELRTKYGDAAIAGLIAINSYIMHRKNYRFNKSAIPAIAQRYGIDVFILNELIFKYDFFQTEDDGEYIFSLDTRDDMISYQAIVEGGRKGGTQRAINEGQNLKNSTEFDEV